MASKDGKKLLARGMGASPGIATGELAFQAADVLSIASSGRSVILVRIDATPEDVPALQAAVGVITTHGGVTGDAAIVARTLGKPCVAACSRLHVDYVAERLTVRADGPSDENVVLEKGAVITIDGSRGEILAG